MVFALTACGGNPGEDEKNPEFAKFSSQAVAIMSTVDMTAGDEEQVNTSAKSVVQKNVLTTKQVKTAPSATEIETLFNLVKEHNQSEVVENVNKEYADCLEDCFTAPLGVGDVITNKHGATNFYGVKVRIDYGSGLYGGCVVTNSGNKTEIYLFDPQGGEDAERYAYLKLIYNSKTDYNFERIDYTQDLNHFLYYYGDSNQNFISLTKLADEQDSTTAYNNAYVSNGMTCYSVCDVSGEEVDAYIENLITNKNPHQYNNQINATKSGTSYTVGINDIIEATEKYIEQSGEDEDEFYPIYVTKEGVVRSVNVGDDFDCETVIIPAKATAFEDNLMLNPNCTKVIIPDSVTSFKITKDTAYWWEGKDLPDDDPTKDDFVDAPVGYVLEYFQITAGYNWDTTKHIEFVFSENNKLFKTGADGNVYLTYGGGEYLAYIYNYDAENLKHLDGNTDINAVNDFRNNKTSFEVFPTFTKNAREQLKKSNHKFQSITLGNAPITDYLTTDGTSTTETYTVDTVTCYGNFDTLNFYRIYDNNIIENSNRVTRIKELIIKPEFWYIYEPFEDIDLEEDLGLDPNLSLSNWEDFKTYIDAYIQYYYNQNGITLTYNQVFEMLEDKNLKTKQIEASGIDFRLEDDNIQIDKITFDSSIESIWLYGIFTENIILDIPETTNILLGEETEMYSEVKFYVNEKGQVNGDSVDGLLEKYKGKIEFIVTHTQAEVNYLINNITGDGVVETYKTILNLIETQSDKYTITYAENIDIVSIADSDLTPYFDYYDTWHEDYGLTYEGAYYPLNANSCEGFTLYLTNMVEEIDFTKYVTCATDWDYKVYYGAYDEDLQQKIYVENNGKVVNLALGETFHNGMYSLLYCKIVGTNSQTGETKNLYITFNVNGKSQFTVGHYTYDTYDMSNSFSDFKEVVVKDGEGNVIEDLANIPLEYGENIFIITVTNDYGTSTYKQVIIRPYLVVNISNENAEINLYNYANYANEYKIFAYDIEGNEVSDVTSVSLNVGDNIYKIVWEWNADYEMPEDESVPEPVMYNFKRAAE